MAEKTLKTKIILRNDSASTWETANTLLAKGEVAVELEMSGTSYTGKAKIKIGDGVHNYNDLKYVGGDECKTYEASSLSGLPTSVTAELHSGDIGIVKELIDDGKYQYTAYVYDNSVTGATKWVAMDGNYSAENVYFKTDLSTNYTLGQITGSLATPGTITAAGKNLKEVFDSIFLKEDNTDLKQTAPYVSVSPNGTTEYVEIGNSFSSGVSITFNSGSYKYGYKSGSTITTSGTGATAGTYTWKIDSTTSKTASSGTAQTITIPAQSSKIAKTIKCCATYSGAGNPVSNIGTEYSDQTYADGVTSDVTAVNVRWYVPMYHGFKLTAASKIDFSGTISASDITGLTKITGATAYNQTKPTTETASGSWYQYILAIPSSYYSGTPTCKDSNNLTCTIVKHGTYVVINDIAYDIYHLDNAAAYDTKTIILTW